MVPMAGKTKAPTKEEKAADANKKGDEAKQHRKARAAERAKANKTAQTAAGHNRGTQPNR